ncbi:hypothetical protein DM50_4053 [Burkholderia mallei]|nr:hypothetical protein DM45_3043 [Burkholderia mallei]KOT02892.1 hypothetical protein DM50_4053 [Burkholderia mallei]
MRRAVRLAGLARFTRLARAIAAVATRFAGTVAAVAARFAGAITAVAARFAGAITAVAARFASAIAAAVAAGFARAAVRAVRAMTAAFASAGASAAAVGAARARAASARTGAARVELDRRDGAFIDALQADGRAQHHQILVERLDATRQSNTVDEINFDALAFLARGIDEVVLRMGFCRIGH